MLQQPTTCPADETVLANKNETSRFLGEGVSFKAKLIGILEVSEARGDRMCQEALSDLKMAIRAAGEHKQRITINIAIDGLRLRDEKTGDSLYHHPVHKISFIAQDMSDSRAFGYIFGSPDTGHRFFGIKTDKAASQVVIAMRDLFQVVFALKKKEIELAKQHLDKTRTTPFSYSDRTSLLSSKNNSTSDSAKSSLLDTKGASNAESRPTPAVADLVDLELELNSLQQGLTQMERITPSDPFGSKDDPFGDSFTSFPQKPILPPPPSGRERSSRTSESGSLFSPKTPHNASVSDQLFGDFNTSHEEASSGDWFTPPVSGGGSLFEDVPPVSPAATVIPPVAAAAAATAPPAEQTSKEQKHAAVKLEIMSQFDVFTELDPLGTDRDGSDQIGTGKNKPYVDKKHFFKELKNPPKKVLNDLVSESLQQPPTESSLFAVNFDKTPILATSPNAVTTTSTASNSNIYDATDPFGEDPFDKSDPFADSDFGKQDVFDTEFNDFNKVFKLNDLSSAEHKIPNTAKQIESTQFDYKPCLSKLYENPSLDLSSEAEPVAPEPPPRPSSTLMPQIKPPPLPPKKQAAELVVAKAPPPRPPLIEDGQYESLLDRREEEPSEAEEAGPPLPVPARKSKFESDFVAQVQSQEDYLTPIAFLPPKPHVQVPAGDSSLVLPPPQRMAKKNKVLTATEGVIAGGVEDDVRTNESALNLEGLDITLSQLTLSGLNELATKLNIPATELSNMTLVQLTTYLTNFIKNTNGKSALPTEELDVPNKELPSEERENEIKANRGDSDIAVKLVNADFADFNNFNSITSNESMEISESYDRYAVFREFLEQEQAMEQTEPVEQDESEQAVIVVESDIVTEEKTEELKEVVDKYAALREIVESELKLNECSSIEEAVEEDEEEEKEVEADEEEEDDVYELEPKQQLETIDESIMEQNHMNDDRTLCVEIEPETGLVDILDNDLNENVTMMENNTATDAEVLDNTVTVEIKAAAEGSAAPETRQTSGSLSDVVSGSSPEVDLTGSASENAAKKSDTPGESWAIFDPPNSSANESKAVVQSEEGVSPWSSDSKEFNNGSPPEYRQRLDSGSGGDQWSGRAAAHRSSRDSADWWDTAAEPEVQYYPANNRRSTDSYDDYDEYECYDRPRRRRQTSSSNWVSQGPGGGAAGGGGGGGHSSSSRDVSPWEEEPRRRPGWSSRYHHSRQQHSFERHHRDRRHNDSWDEDDDYEYEDEPPNRFHWSDRHSARDDWSDDGRLRVQPALSHRRRRELDREQRWCCPDYEMAEKDKPPSRYSSGRWSNPERRERYYSGAGRDNDSPWDEEDDYGYTRRRCLRPSSASDMDRKTADLKIRQVAPHAPHAPPPAHNYFSSDGERERRYKSSAANRRSRSRDSNDYTSMSATGPIPPSARLLHRSQFAENKDQQQLPPQSKKSASISSSSTMRKKKSVEVAETATFPRKGGGAARNHFENDFVPSETESSPMSGGGRMAMTAAEVASKRFTFDADFEAPEAETTRMHSRPRKPTVPAATVVAAALSPCFDNDPRRYKAKPMRYKQKSLFEDDFSPAKKSEPEDVPPIIVSIKEEQRRQQLAAGSVNQPEPENEPTRQTRKQQQRLSRLAASRDLKKSESVNIFGRDSDPFDDDFFTSEPTAAAATPPIEAPPADGGAAAATAAASNGDVKWSERFSDDFDQHERAQ